MWASLETRTDNMPAFGFHALGTLLSLVLQNAADARHARLTAPCPPAEPRAPSRPRRPINYYAERSAQRTMRGETPTFCNQSAHTFSPLFSAPQRLTPTTRHTT